MHSRQETQTGVVGSVALGGQRFSAYEARRRKIRTMRYWDIWEHVGTTFRNLKPFLLFFAVIVAREAVCPLA